MENILVYAISILTLIIGILSLFVSKETKNKISLWILIILLSISSVTSIYIELTKNNENKIISSKIENTLDNTKNTFENTIKILDLLTNDFAMKNDSLIIYNNDVLINSLNADKYIKLYEDKIRNLNKVKATIQYFPKDFDSQKIKEILTQSDFNIEILKPNNKIITNSIWYGNNVDKNELKYISLLAIRAGIDIKKIKHINKNNIIQIGADPEFINAKSISLEEILNL